MASDHEPAPAQCSAATTSELNNLLQIISGTVSLIEDLCSGTDVAKPYFAMIHESIERAKGVTAKFTGEAGGATEKVRLHPELSARRQAKAALPTIRSKPSIIIVDDEPMAAMLMKRTLTNSGFRVSTVRSGFECLDLLRRRPRDFDMFIVDLTMPFMDGEETFERIRDINPNVPVVIATGFIEHQQLDRLLSVGLAAFLHKPYSPDELLSCVNSVLASSNLLRQGSSSGGLAVSY